MTSSDSSWNLPVILGRFQKNTVNNSSVIPQEDSAFVGPKTVSSSYPTDAIPQVALSYKLLGRVL
jgi:hypothetical protein